jgi:hypothetical protein
MKLHQGAQKFNFLVLLTLAFGLIPLSLFAQVPQGVPYQAVMRNADGSVMASLLERPHYQC